MISERDVLEAMRDGVVIAREALDKERRAVIKQRRHLPIEQQPLDAGYWYQREMDLANQLHSIEQQLAMLDERGVNADE